VVVSYSYGSKDRIRRTVAVTGDLLNLTIHHHQQQIKGVAARGRGLLPPKSFFDVPGETGRTTGRCRGSSRLRHSASSPSSPCSIRRSKHRPLLAKTPPTKAGHKLLSLGLTDRLTNGDSVGVVDRNRFLDNAVLTRLSRPR
jgi:hypothetical protein